MKEITLNKETELYSIPCDGGWTCLGYDVLERRHSKLESELVALGIHKAKTPEPRGTLERYAQYENLLKIAGAHNAKTGWRSESELTPELIGKEGKRVRVIHEWKSGNVETEEFTVGKSCGFIPCHLQLKSSRSSGGPAVCLGKIKSVRCI